MDRSVKFLFTFLVLLISFFSNAQVTVLGNFTFENLNRTFRVYIPASYTGNDAVPLILNLHGYGSNALEQELYTNFKPISDSAGFILVHPNGSVDNFGNQNWNTFGISNVNDVGFISALLDTLSAWYNIDTNCVYSTGMSNGGFMSYKLACELGNKIAAIASVTGSMTWNEYNTCNPLRPVPLMEIHGTADNTVPYNGSFLFAPVDSVVNFWVINNGCTLIPTVTQMPDSNTTDNSTAENYLYENGINGSTVELFKIIGGGHSWPGAPVTIDVTNQDINASVEIWRFFRKYKLNILTEIIDVDSIKNYFEIYPNPSTGKIIINFATPKTRNIFLRDLSGKLISVVKSGESKLMLTIPLKGIYFLSVSENSGHYSKKIVIY